MPTRRIALVGLAGLIGLALTACGRDHGAPRVRPLPKVDGGPALRGGGPPRSTRIASYKIDAKLDVAQHQITATQTLTWVNAGASSVDKLPFHLYLNAFKNESSLFLKSSRGVLRDVRAGAWGWIDVDSVVVGGAELVGHFLPTASPDETVMELALPQPVAAGATIDVTMKFTAQLPELWARSGYKHEFHLVGQWFPKIGVRVGPPGAERWECQPYHAFTEFFADFGTYDVTLTVPNTYVVAATGVLTNVVESPGGTSTFTYRAEDVHDFAWMADPYMETISAMATVENGLVEVRVVHRPEQLAFAQRHLEAGVAAIETFSAWFVPYPWPIMTIVDPPMAAVGGAGGMEYPTFVTTAGDAVYARPGLRLPEYVTVHEVGHNWFQGILASNEPIEAWLDEGVNSWADANAMDHIYGARASGVDWMGWQGDVFSLTAAISDEPSSLPAPIATAAYAFSDAHTYGMATYVTTMRALHTLENVVGPKKFAAAMKKYAQTWAFEHPTGRDLFDVLNTELGQDLTWFFGPVFQNVGGMRLGIRTAVCRHAHPPRGVIGAGSARKTVKAEDAKDPGTYVCEVVVTNTGPVHVPVDIELRFADGSAQRVRWEAKGNGSWERFVVERSSRLAEVWIDPDDQLAMESPVKHRYRIEPDGSASLRAGAWAAWLTQSLMQVVGP